MVGLQAKAVWVASLSVEPLVGVLKGKEETEAI